MVAGVCVTLSSPPSFRATEKSGSEGAKECSVQKSCGCPPISTPRYLIEHTRRQRQGRWLKVGWTLPRCRHPFRAGRRVHPLEQGAGAFWEGWGCVRGAVTHGQYVIVAGDVAAAREVIGALGEAGGHSIGSLQDTHCWLCDSLGKKEENKTEWDTLRMKSGRHRMRHKGERRDACNWEAAHISSYQGSQSLYRLTAGHMTRGAISCRTLLSSTHQSNNTLTNIIDIPARTAQEGGSASKGHLTVGGGLHLHIAALCGLASQPWWVSNGGVRILTIQGAGAVAAHGALGVICSSRETRTYSATTKMNGLSLSYCSGINPGLWYHHSNLNWKSLENDSDCRCHSEKVVLLLSLTGD